MCEQEITYYERSKNTWIPPANVRREEWKLCQKYIKQLLEEICPQNGFSHLQSQHLCCHHKSPMAYIACRSWHIAFSLNIENLQKYIVMYVCYLHVFWSLGWSSLRLFVSGFKILVSFFPNFNKPLAKFSVQTCIVLFRNAVCLSCFIKLQPSFLYKFFYHESKEYKLFCTNFFDIS